MAGVYCSNSKNKVRVGFTSIENAGIRYCWGFILLQLQNQGTVGVLYC